MTTPREAARLLGKLGGQKGGQSTSPKKQAAARRNGKKGGRPKKLIDNPNRIR